MHRTPSSDTFEKLMMKLTNKEAVHATNHVLKHMNNVHKLIDEDHDRSVSLLSKTASRVFLTCFMILSFNDDVFSNKGFLEEKLIEEAKKTLESFEHFRMESGESGESEAHRDHKLVDQFITNFHNFTNLFNILKSKDAEQIVEVLCKAYYELGETLNVVMRGRGGAGEEGAGEEGAGESEEEEDIRIWREEIESQKAKVLDQIKIIGGKKGLDRLKDLEDKWMEKVDVLDDKSMLEIARKAYWDKMRKDLDAETPNREGLYALLEEIRDRLNRFTPRRDDIIGENNAAIDGGLLKRSIEGGAFDNADFLKLSNFIIERILNFETPAENERTKKWRDELFAKFSGKTVKYSYILPDLMRGICERLDKIEYDYKRYIEGCNKRSCGHCGAQDFEAVIPSYMGRPSMPRCPDCNHMLVDLSSEQSGEESSK